MTAQNVRVILANPKYTGHMVYGRHHNRNGHRIPAPPDQWLWSRAPVHPPIIDRATWDAAQQEPRYSWCWAGAVTQVTQLTLARLAASGVGGHGSDRM